MDEAILRVKLEADDLAAAPVAPTAPVAPVASIPPPVAAPPALPTPVKPTAAVPAPTPEPAPLAPPALTADERKEAMRRYGFTPAQLDDFLGQVAATAAPSVPIPPPQPAPRTVPQPAPQISLPAAPPQPSPAREEGREPPAEPRLEIPERRPTAPPPLPPTLGIPSVAPPAIPAEPVQAPPDFDPFAKARESMEREMNAKRIEDARRLIDTEYRHRKEKEEQAQREREARDAQHQSRQSIGFAGQAMGQLGVPGAGLVSAAAAGPVGLALAGAATIVAAIKDAVSTVVNVGGKTAGSVMQFDAVGINRGFADLASKVPIVGGVFGGLINTTLDLSDAMLATARRLSAYDADLAMGVARLDIDRIMRDIERARTHGPDILAAVERRASFEQKWEEFIDRMMPHVLKFLDTMMNFLEDNAESIASTITAVLQVLVMIAKVIGAIMSVFLPFASSLLGGLDRIEASVRPRDDEGPFMREFMALAAPAGTIRPRGGPDPLSSGVPRFAP